MTFEEGQTVWVRGTVVRGTDRHTVVRLESKNLVCAEPGAICVFNETLRVGIDIPGFNATIVTDDRAYDPLHSYERYRLPRQGFCGQTPGHPPHDNCNGYPPSEAGGPV